MIWVFTKTDTAFKVVQNEHRLKSHMSLLTDSEDMLSWLESLRCCVSTADLLRVLTTHPTYHRVIEHLQPEGAKHLPAFDPLASRKAVNNNRNVHNGNGSFHYGKKFD